MKEKICFVLTVEFALKAFLIEHLKMLSKQFEITVVVNTQNPNLLNELGIHATLIPLNIARDISPLRDLAILFSLIKLFYSNKFDAVHSITPKAGLLAMLASSLVGITARTHTFTGQVWANKAGVKRFILKCFDKLIAALSIHTIVDSPSQLNFLISEGVIDKKKAFVIGKGSVSGVNIDKFKPNPQARGQLRSKLNVHVNEVLFLFLGRLNPDKGVLDLATAFIQAGLSNSRLLFVGPDECNMQAQIAALENFDSANISFIGYTDQPQNFMVAADVLFLPSYREGFGSVIIEASACGIPAVGSRVYGITDAIVENTTGLMHEAGNVADLQKKLERIATDKVLRERLGKQAHNRAINDFNSELIAQAWYDFYREVIFNHD